MTPTDDPLATSSDLQPGSLCDDERVDIDVLGELLIRVREFSLFLTRTLELSQQDAFASNNDLIVLISLHLDGPQRPRRLAASAGLSSGGMSLLLDRLQVAGWIRRRRGALDDGRAVVVELTDVGAAAVERTGTATTAAFAAGRPLLDDMRHQLTLMGLDIPPEATRGPRGLDALRQCVDTGHLLYTAIAAATGPYDDAANTFHVLWLARGADGTRPVSIAVATGLSSAGTSDLLDRLEAKGFVRRSPDTHPDGRAVLVNTTPEGSRALDAAIVSTRPLLGHIAAALFLI